MIACLTLMAPDVINKVSEDFGTLGTITLPDPKPPSDEVVEKKPPEKPPEFTIAPEPVARTTPVPTTLKPLPAQELDPQPVLPPLPKAEDAPIVPPKAEVITPKVEATPKPATPVRTAPKHDTRFAGQMQPRYPESMRREGVEGRVVVRVLIGEDGRVKGFRPVSAPNPAFFETTQAQAMNKWRFKPATIDGKPTEDWLQLSLIFNLEN